MLHQRPSHKNCWLNATVEALYPDTDGEKVMLRITKVYGRANEDAADFLEGKTAILPVTLLGKASSFVVNTDKRRIDFGDHDAGHSLTDNVKLTAFVSCDGSRKEEVNLGLIEAHAWNHEHVFKPLHQRVWHLQNAHHEEIARQELIAEQQRNVPFQILVGGEVRNGNLLGGRVVTTQKLEVLSRYFQHRAFPTALPNGEPVRWKGMKDSRFQLIDAPRILVGGKHINAPWPKEISNDLLEQLLETVKDVEPQVRKEPTRKVGPNDHLQTAGRVGLGDAFKNAIPDRNAKAKPAPTAPTPAPVAKTEATPADDKVVPLPTQGRKKTPNVERRLRKPRPGDVNSAAA